MLVTLFEAARRAGAPIVAIRTADPSATIAVLAPVLARMNDPAAKAPADNPIIQWDASRGLTGYNKAGQAALSQVGVKAEETVDFGLAMSAAAMLPPKVVLFARHAHRQLHSQEPAQTAAAMQAVANLRDKFKVDFRMLVFVGPVFKAPVELEHDVVVMDDALPGPAALAAIVTEMHGAVKPPLPKPAPDKLAKAVDALSGLSTFAAEQVVAMSLTATGLDLDALWDRKRATVEQTPGLVIWRGGERFSDIVGMDAVKAKVRQRLRARTPVGVVVWIDEIDKALANVESDTTGVRMYQLLKLLTEMENNRWHGLVAAGVGGGGKSLLAKAVGNEAGVPTIAFDLGATESKYVGESEENFNRALQIIKAVGAGHAYFIATSNAATVMRPELQRRFTDGFWMFDLMTSEEKAACWSFYMKRYELKAQARPADVGWTGAEIRNCCESAWDSGVTLAEAAQFIVPMAQSRGDEIERLRRYAHGRFLDARVPGIYQYQEAPMSAAVRSITLAPGSSLPN